MMIRDPLLSFFNRKVIMPSYLYRPAAERLYIPPAINRQPSQRFSEDGPSRPRAYEAAPPAQEHQPHYAAETPVVALSPETSLRDDYTRAAPAPADVSAAPAPIPQIHVPEEEVAAGDVAQSTTVVRSAAETQVFHDRWVAEALAANCRPAGGLAPPGRERSRSRSNSTSSARKPSLAPRQDWYLDSFLRELAAGNDRLHKNMRSQAEAVLLNSTCSLWRATELLHPRFPLVEQRAVEILDRPENAPHRAAFFRAAAAAVSTAPGFIDRNGDFDSQLVLESQSGPGVRFSFKGLKESFVIGTPVAARIQLVDYRGNSQVFDFAFNTSSENASASSGAALMSSGIDYAVQDQSSRKAFLHTVGAADAPSGSGRRRSTSKKQSRGSVAPGQKGTDPNRLPATVVMCL